MNAALWWRKSWAEKGPLGLSGAKSSLGGAVGTNACPEHARREREKRVSKERRQATPLRVCRHRRQKGGGSARGRGATGSAGIDGRTLACGGENSQAAIPGRSERRRDPGRKWGVWPQVRTTKAQEEDFQAGCTGAGAGGWC